jgi:hypothetical protein
MSDNHKKLSDDKIMEKVLEALRYSGLAFSKELGYKSHGTIHNILKKQNSISQEMINRITGKFPQVNYLFLTKGQEPVLLDRKLAKNQLNVLFPDVAKMEKPIYDEEVFLTLKSIDFTMKKILEILETKKGDDK